MHPGSLQVNPGSLQVNPGSLQVHPGTRSDNRMMGHLDLLIFLYITDDRTRETHSCLNVFDVRQFLSLPGISLMTSLVYGKKLYNLEHFT